MKFDIKTTYIVLLVIQIIVTSFFCLTIYKMSALITNPHIMDRKTKDFMVATAITRINVYITIIVSIIFFIKMLYDNVFVDILLWFGIGAIISNLFIQSSIYI